MDGILDEILDLICDYVIRSIFGVRFRIIFVNIIRLTFGVRFGIIFGIAYRIIFWISFGSIFGILDRIIFGIICIWVKIFDNIFIIFQIILGIKFIIKFEFTSRIRYGII